MQRPRSLTGSIHLPDARLTFYLRFVEKEQETAPTGAETELLGRILDKAMESSPEVREVLINFADYIHKATEQCGQSRQ